jgi:hypothetical protein
LFGIEAFKSRRLYSEAAFALLKMTGEVRRCTIEVTVAVCSVANFRNVKSDRIKQIILHISNGHLGSVGGGTMLPIYLYSMTTFCSLKY